MQCGAMTKKNGLIRARNGKGGRTHEVRKIIETANHEYDAFYADNNHPNGIIYTIEDACRVIAIREGISGGARSLIEVAEDAPAWDALGVAEVLEMLEEISGQKLSAYDGDPYGFIAEIEEGAK